MEYKLLNLENDKKALFEKKWNFNYFNEFKNSIHSCIKKMEMIGPLMVNLIFFI